RTRQTLAGALYCGQMRWKIAGTVGVLGTIAVAASALAIHSVRPFEALGLVATTVMMVWSTVDAVLIPLEKWEAADRSKEAWVGGLAFGTVFQFVGWFVAAVYLIWVRPYVMRGERGPRWP